MSICQWTMPIAQGKLRINDLLLCKKGICIRILCMAGVSQQQMDHRPDVQQCQYREHIQQNHNNSQQVQPLDTLSYTLLEQEPARVRDVCDILFLTVWGQCIPTLVEWMRYFSLLGTFRENVISLLQVDEHIFLCRHGSGVM